MSSRPNVKPLQVAVVAEDVQLMDIACIDCLAGCSTEYIKASETFGAGHLVPASVPMTIHYPSSDMKPTVMTGGIKFQPTCTYDECPRDLDVLLVGGPPPSTRPEGADKLFKECFARTKVVMTTCVGSMWLASSGVLDGHRATTNRGALKMAQQFHPKVKWAYGRWIVEKKEGGELWTSGGAQAGIDMVATYIRQNYPKELTDYVLESLDVDETVRGETYKESASQFM